MRKRGTFTKENDGVERRSLRAMRFAKIIEICRNLAFGHADADMRQKRRIRLVGN
jgi:hypothetical protein